MNLFWGYEMNKSILGFINAIYLSVLVIVAPSGLSAKSCDWKLFLQHESEY